MVKKREIFDFIYIDADKKEYPKYYELALKLSKEGTLIAIDNALWAGLVAESETNYSHAKIINQLNKKIFYRFQYAVTLVPAWDGLLVVQVNKLI